MEPCRQVERSTPERLDASSDQRFAELYETDFGDGINLSTSVCASCSLALKRRQSRNVTVQILAFLVAFLATFVIFLLLTSSPNSPGASFQQWNEVSVGECKESLGTDCYAPLSSGKFLPASPRVREWQLGGDPYGYVPPVVGTPLAWQYLDIPELGFIDSEVLDDPDKFNSVVERLDFLSKPTHIRTLSHLTTYKSVDGSVLRLEPLNDSSLNEPTYHLRGLYQVECVKVLTEYVAHTFAQLNLSSIYGSPPASKFTLDRLATCLNELRTAVLCSADVQPINLLVQEKRWCRDFDAVKSWAEKKMLVGLKDETKHEYSS